MHGVTFVDFGVFMYMVGGEDFACKVGNPVIKLVVTLHYEASLLGVKGVADVKCRNTSIAMFW